MKSLKPITLAKKIAQLCSDKKGEDIVILNVSKISSFCDYFVIVTALVEQHINSLSEHLMMEIKKVYGVKPSRVEGKEFKKWVVLDYGAVIVHLMTPEMREFYALERVWSKGKKIKYETASKKSNK